MNDINSVNSNHREPSHLAAPLRPVETGEGARSGSPLPPQASSGRVTGQPEQGSVTQAVREASRPEPADRAEQAAGVNEESLSNAVTQMNEFIQSTQRDLRFNIDEETGHTVVKVIDRQTEELIRQIPDEIFLKLARHLKDNQDDPVHLFNEQA